MHKVKPFAIFLIALCAILAGARAQNVYKCGASYSQTPCDGGVVVDIADKRDNAQKLQAQQVSAKDARAADAMEKSRLQKEKAALAPADTVFIDEPSAASPVKQAKPKTPEKFVAQGPGLKTAKPALKKKAKKKKTTPS